MGSRHDTVDFLVEQFAAAGTVSARKMFATISAGQAVVRGGGRLLG